MSEGNVDFGIPATQPRLRHNLPVPPPSRRRPYGYGPRIVGAPDALYLATGGDAATLVSHYRDGELAWSWPVGLARPGSIHLVGDRLLVDTYSLDSGLGSTLGALDAVTGAVAWSRQSPRMSQPLLVGHRWFLPAGDGTGPDPYGIIEFDPVSGAELNRFNASNVIDVDLGFASIDAEAATVQLIDVELQPTGPAVSLGWYAGRDIDRDELGWIVSTGPGAYGMSPDGERQFECIPTVGNVGREWDSAHRIDDHLLAVLADDAVEVFDVSGGSAASVWGNAPDSYDDIQIDINNSRLVRYTFPVGDDGRANHWGTGTRVDVMDWRTGSVIATGTDDLLVDDNGRMVTHEAEAIVAREVDSGNELWRIPTPRSAELAMLGSAVVIVTVGDGSATMSLYAE